MRSTPRGDELDTHPSHARHTRRVDIDGVHDDGPLSLFPDTSPNPRVKYSSKDTTLVSELATALGMIRRTLPEAMAHLPSELHGVSPTEWDQLCTLHDDGRQHSLFAQSFGNGRAFATSEVALRHRQPGLVEWCGPRKLRGEHAIPADLRVDDVYLVSCKYESRNLLNSGPAKLFDHRLKEARRGATSWYEEVAGEAYQRYYDAVRTHYGLGPLPDLVTALGDDDRAVLAKAVPSLLPTDLAEAQSEFSWEVARASAERWERSIASAAQRMDFAMTLLRIPQAIYFLLGQSGRASLRFKVLSRWDWAQRYRLQSFRVEPARTMQPTVTWSLDVHDRILGLDRTASGHVEIRWSHGRFNKAPEAKVYLDSALSDTPGYVTLDGS